MSILMSKRFKQAYQPAYDVNEEIVGLFKGFDRLVYVETIVSIKRTAIAADLRQLL